MKKIARKSVILIVLLMICQNIACADSPTRKLGRGLANVTMGWAEIFTTTKRASEEHGYIAGCLYGLTAGIGRAIWRTSVGVYETITFPLPIPQDYQPIMEPEYVVDSLFFE